MQHISTPTAHFPLISSHFWCALSKRGPLFHIPLVIKNITAHICRIKWAAQKLDFEFSSLLFANVFLHLCARVQANFCRCLRTCEYFLLSVSSSLPRGVNIILLNHFQTRSPFPYWGIRTVVTCASSLSDFLVFDSFLSGFLNWSVQSIVFTCWGEVASHNSIIVCFIVHWHSESPAGFLPLRWTVSHEFPL